MEIEMKKSVRVFIQGVVQGMFFRDFIKQQADRLGVKGFVRNLEDGRVEVFLESDVDSVNAMTEICRKGPQHAQIRKMEVVDEKFQDFKDFRIVKI